MEDYKNVGFSIFLFPVLYFVFFHLSWYAEEQQCTSVELCYVPAFLTAAQSVPQVDEQGLPETLRQVTDAAWSI